MFKQLNNPARKMMLAFLNRGESISDEAVSATDVEAWVKVIRGELLSYLGARMEAGAKLNLTAEGFAKFEKLAEVHALKPNFYPAGENIIVSFLVPKT